MKLTEIDNKLYSAIYKIHDSTNRFKDIKDNVSRLASTISTSGPSPSLLQGIKECVEFFDREIDYIAVQSLTELKTVVHLYKKHLNELED